MKELSIYPSVKRDTFMKRSFEEKTWLEEVWKAKYDLCRYYISAIIFYTGS